MTRRIVAAVASLGAALLVGISPGYASEGFTLFGDATLTAGHNSPTGVQLRSTFDLTTHSSGFGGVDFAIPSGTTFADVQNLATDYIFTEASCGGGSPRFQINVGGANAFVYLGPPPSYTGCASNVWLNTGNLVSAASFVDTSQLPGGAFYDTFAAADAKYGSMAVTGIQLVVDSGWFFGATETVVVDNVQINGTTFTFESAQSCKDGGWQSFTSTPGPFKNQGDCVSYFATGGRNAAG